MEGNDGQAIVEQMRRQMEFAKSRGKLGLTISVLFLVIFIAFLGHTTWQSHHYGIETEVSWDGVYEQLDQGRMEEGLRIAQQLIESSPHYYYAHSCLADAYLANGDVSNALEHYTVAFELFPSEDMEQELQAIRKRVQMEQSK